MEFKYRLSLAMDVLNLYMFYLIGQHRSSLEKEESNTREGDISTIILKVKEKLELLQFIIHP